MDDFTYEGVVNELGIWNPFALNCLDLQQSMKFSIVIVKRKMG